MRVYTVCVAGATIANTGGDCDLVEISPADDKPVRLLGFTIANVGADVGDAAEEMLQLSVIRGYTTSGSGGSANTPTPLDAIDTAAGFAAEINNTTIASNGTPITCWSGGWNIRVPLTEIWGDANNLLMCPMASQANTTIVLRNHTTVTDDITASWTLWVAEGY